MKPIRIPLLFFFVSLVACLMAQSGRLDNKALNPHPARLDADDARLLQAAPVNRSVSPRPERRMLVLDGNDFSRSAPSSAGNGQTASPSACVTPTGLTATYVHYSAFSMQWSAAAGALQYRLRLSTNGGASWSTPSGWFPGTAVSVLNRPPNTAHLVQVQDTCATGLSAWSSSLSILTLGAGDPYCYSYGSTIGEWIDAVQFGSINNVSGDNLGYRNYTALSTTVQKGQSYAIAITPQNDDTNDAINWRVWIDFNKDNDFNDAGETVVSTTGNDQSVLNATIPIPTTASTGTTRMRVCMAYSTVNGPCDTQNWRDVEDYTVNITAPANCNVPTGLYASDVFQREFRLNWSAAAGAIVYRTRVRVVGTAWGAPGSWTTLTNRRWIYTTPGTAYECQVQDSCATGLSAWSPTTPITVTTLNTNPYCAAYGLTDWFYIDDVQIGNIQNNGSGDGFGYRNYASSMSTDLQQGQPYALQIMPFDNDDFSDDVNWRVWVDLNKDNDFNDAGELLVSVNGDDNTPLNANLTIPTTASLGTTRMRVMMTDASSPTPCLANNADYTDVEDYSVNITFVPSLSVAPNTFSFDGSGTPSQTLTVTSNCSAWQLNNLPSWIHASPTSGNGNGTIAIYCDPAPCTQSRNATFYVQGCNLTSSITVTQTGATLDVSTQQINFGSSGGNVPFSVFGECSAWTVTSGNLSWLTTMPTNGSFDMNVTAQCYPNPTPYPRQTTLTIAGCCSSETINIDQAAGPVVLSPTPASLQNLPHTSGITNVSLESNCNSWTIVSDQSWVTPSPSGGGIGSAINIAVSYQANPSTQPRSATLTITGCGGIMTIPVEQDGVPFTLTVSPTSLTFDGLGTPPQSVNVASNCNSWTVTSSQSWAQPSLTNGSGTVTFTVSCTPNSSASSRTAIITISGCNVSRTVNVTQTGAVLSISPSSLAFDASGLPPQSVSVVSTCSSWTVTSSQTWAQPSLTNGSGTATFTVSCTPNGSTSSRMATITISGCNVSRTVSVTQSGATLSVSPSNLVFDASGVPPQTVSVSSTCSAWTAVSNTTWAKISAPNGSGNGSFTVSCDPNSSPNSRTATITISGCSASGTVTITQNGAATTLSASPVSLVFDATGLPPQTVSVASNCSSWTVSSSQTWAVPSVTNGSGNGSFTVSCLQNSSTASRTATITIFGCSTTTTVTVTQNGAAISLTVSPAGLVFDATGLPPQTVSVASNCTSWTVSSSQSWAKISGTTGSGNGSFTVYCDPNSSPQSRSAIITVSGCSLVGTVTVTQNGTAISLTVSPAGLVFDASGVPPQTVSVASNCSAWTVSTGGATWVHPSVMSGSGNGSFTVSCDPNSSPQSRLATITVSGCSLVGTVTVMQNGAAISLTVSPASLSFDTTGLPPQTVSVASNCSAWTVSSSQTWAKVSGTNGSGNGSFTVFCDKNTTTQTRTAVITISGCNATQQVSISQTGKPANPVPWNPVPTSESHTVVLPNTLTSNFGNGQQLAVGDAIGFFYDQNGTLTCGGMAIWTGANTVATVYGNDATPPAKNGFAANETFSVKVWIAASNQIINSTATYAPVGSNGGLVTHTNQFSKNGVSLITNLERNTVVTHNVPLTTGWNLISSYVAPAQPDVLQVLAPVGQQVFLMKGCDGLTAIPSLSINNIGAWDIKQGYWIKASTAVQLPIVGQKIDPSATPINIAAGWQCIPYLRDNPRNIATELAAVQNSISLVKNGAGKTYIPALGINDIGNLTPCQGYQLKALSPFTLLYSPNLLSADDRGDNWVSTERNGIHFMLDSNISTGNNATIAFPMNVLQSKLIAGDEIGLFTPEGRLCGAGVFNGVSLAVTVWGDDTSTPDAKEGFTPGDSYTLRVWLSGLEQERGLTVNYAVGDNIYNPDDLEIVDDIDIAPASAAGAPNGDALGAFVLPNPAQAEATLVVQLDRPTELAADLWSLDGRRLLAICNGTFEAGEQRFSFRWGSKLPAGAYLLKITTPTGTLARRLVVAE